MENQKTKLLISAGTHSITSSLFVLALSIAFMVVGYYQGEIDSYFQKAVLVCTQCIGLG